MQSFSRHQYANQEAVIMHYQQSMLQITQAFFASQQAVMLCYLCSENFQHASHDTPTRATAPAQICNPLMSPLMPVDGSRLSAPTVPVSVQPTSSVVSHNATESVESLSTLPEPPRTETDRLSSSADEIPQVIAAPAENSPDLSQEAMVTALLDLVSERTGYPVEMLDHNLDLESDLGIDSIKRIEILNRFQTFLPEARQAFLKSRIEELAAARTLSQLIEWIDKPIPESTDSEPLVSSTESALKSLPADSKADNSAPADDLLLPQGGQPS